MTEYHTIYKGPEGETTQWEDIQRRLGNLPAKAPVWKPDAYRPQQEEGKGQAWVDGREGDELEDAEDEFADDRFMEEYRLKRIAQLQAAARRPRFGSVDVIRGAEFVEQVTEASKGRVVEGEQGVVEGQAAPGGAGAGGDPAREPVWVVVQLHKDGHGPSAVMTRAIDDLAPRYPRTKFVRMVSTDCIPDYPDTNLPTLLVYHGGSCVKHMVGLAPYGGQRAAPEQVALALNLVGPVCVSGEEGEEGGEAVARGEDATLVRRLVKRLVAEREEGDESSDFDD